nr:hypothetical protein Iba_chr03aCG7070 [Ipomoea batatas]
MDASTLHRSKRLKKSAAGVQGVNLMLKPIML